MHIFDFWGHPPPSSAAILDSGVQWGLNLRPTRRNEIMLMISIFWKISKSGTTAAHAHSLTFYALARLNRYPRITDAGGFEPKSGFRSLGVGGMGRYASRPTLGF